MRWLAASIGLVALIWLATNPASGLETAYCDGYSNEFHIDNITAVTCPADHFRDGPVLAHAERGGDWMHLNPESETMENVSNKIIFHELGHTLGYAHSDDDRGVVNQSYPDASEPCYIHDTTRRIADTYTGFRVYDLDLHGTQQLINAYAAGEVELEALQWAIQQWADRDSTCSVVLYTSNFGGFGGFYDEIELILDRPRNQIAGYFYGQPSFEARYN